MLVLAIIMLLMHPLLFCIKIIKNKKNKKIKKKGMGKIGVGDHNSRREVANVINDFKHV